MQNSLAKRAESNSLRELSYNTKLVDFSSNDYLGISQLKEYKKSYLKKVNSYLENDKHRLGATGSRLLTGNTDFAESLEVKIAQFHNAESGLIYGSGYTANMGLLSSVPQKGDVIFYDEESHASIKDGIRLSFADKYAFKHNNIEDLKSKLQKHSRENNFVVVESIYSMSGSIAPFEKIMELKDKIDFNLIVDEAHSTGVIGKSGTGLVSSIGLEKDCFARIITFGKALGVHGAIILGSDLLRKYLINFSRQFIYTTALSVDGLLAIESAYEVLPSLNDQREQLQSISKYCNEKMLELGLGNYSEFGPIKFIEVGDVKTVKEVSTHLKENGFNVLPILSPTVKLGKEGLRLSLHAFNTKEQMDSIFQIIKTSI